MSRHAQAQLARIDAADRFELARRHGLENVAAESLRAGESDAEFRSRLLKFIWMRQQGSGFSFRRLIDGMANGGKVTGLEAEVLQESARAAGVQFEPNRVLIPWAAFSRNLTVGVASAGGYLVGTEVGEAVDVLRPFSVTARMGVTYFERLQGNLALPLTAAKSTGGWLSDEFASLPEAGTEQLGQLPFTPKLGGALIEYSRQLSIQAGVESWVRRELLRTIGTLFDAAVINGSGSSGQPLGLLNTPGIATQSGTTLNHAGCTNMKERVATANAPDADIAFLGTPAVRELLENRERGFGSGHVWDGDEVADRPAYVSTDVPAATMIAGAWSQIIVGLWGGGFVFALNPYDNSGFKIGKIQARVIVSADVGVVHPTAFCVSTSVT